MEIKPLLIEALMLAVMNLYFTRTRIGGGNGGNDNVGENIFKKR